MAQAAKSSDKKKGAAKVSAGKKPASSARGNKGSSLQCEVCGFAVVVESVGDIAVRQDSALVCCGTPMKAAASKTRTAAKTKTTAKAAAKTSAKTKTAAKAAGTAKAAGKTKTARK